MKIGICRLTHCLRFDFEMNTTVTFKYYMHEDSTWHMAGNLTTVKNSRIIKCRYPGRFPKNDTKMFIQKIDLFKKILVSKYHDNETMIQEF